jgi:large subunit ribosomal protein L30
MTVAERKLVITQRRSANGSSPAQRETLRSLGLRGIGKSTERPDSPQLRGMVSRISHLVEVSQGEEKRTQRGQAAKTEAEDDG